MVKPHTIETPSYQEKYKRKFAQGSDIHLNLKKGRALKLLPKDFKKNFIVECVNQFNNKYDFEVDLSFVDSLNNIVIRGIPIVEDFEYFDTLPTKKQEEFLSEKSEPYVEELTKIFLSTLDKFVEKTTGEDPKNYSRSMVLFSCMPSPSSLTILWS